MSVYVIFESLIIATVYKKRGAFTVGRHQIFNLRTDLAASLCSCTRPAVTEGWKFIQSPKPSKRQSGKAVKKKGGTKTAES